jgi:hypothetical protein
MIIIIQEFEVKAKTNYTAKCDGQASTFLLLYWIYKYYNIFILKYKALCDFCVTLCNVIRFCFVPGEFERNFIDTGSESATQLAGWKLHVFSINV